MASCCAGKKFAAISNYDGRAAAARLSELLSASCSSVRFNAQELRLFIPAHSSEALCLVFVWIWRYCAC